MGIEVKMKTMNKSKIFTPIVMGILLISIAPTASAAWYEPTTWDGNDWARAGTITVSLVGGIAVASAIIISAPAIAVAAGLSLATSSVLALGAASSTMIVGVSTVVGFLVVAAPIAFLALPMADVIAPSLDYGTAGRIPFLPPINVPSTPLSVPPITSISPSTAPGPGPASAGTPQAQASATTISPGQCVYISGSLATCRCGLNWLDFGCSKDDAERDQAIISNNIQLGNLGAVTKAIDGSSSGLGLEGGDADKAKEALSATEALRAKLKDINHKLNGGTMNPEEAKKAAAQATKDYQNAIAATKAGLSPGAATGTLGSTLNKAGVLASGGAVPERIRLHGSTLSYLLTKLRIGGPGCIFDDRCLKDDAGELSASGKEKMSLYAAREKAPSCRSFNFYGEKDIRCTFSPFYFPPKLECEDFEGGCVEGCTGPGVKEWVPQGSRKACSLNADFAHKERCGNGVCVEYRNKKGEITHKETSENCPDDCLRSGPKSIPESESSGELCFNNPGSSPNPICQPASNSFDCIKKIKQTICTSNTLSLNDNCPMKVEVEINKMGKTISSLKVKCTQEPSDPLHPCIRNGRPALNDCVSTKMGTTNVEFSLGKWCFFDPKFWNPNDPYDSPSGGDVCDFTPGNPFYTLDVSTLA